MLDIDKIKKNKDIKDLLDFSIINVDKSSGPTSFQVSQYIGKLFGIKKSGHLGTLDPGVTGVLPVTLNRACNLTKFLLGADKEYVGIMRLHGDVKENVLQDEIKNLTGIISQMPPRRSSVKRALRDRDVKKFEIIERDGRDVLFRGEVQAGTYIRTLVNDLGNKIGGAHMLELRRIRAGIFREDKSVSLYDVQKAFDDYKKGDDEKLREILIPGEIISHIFRTIEIKSEYSKKCLQGSPIFNKYLGKKDNFSKGETIVAFCDDKFIGCYEVLLEGDIFAKPLYVLS